MKARFLALVALVLGMVSCQQDFVESNNACGEVDFQLSVAAPEFTTRADGDNQRGHDSAYGAIDYFSTTDWDTVDLRYILEVYDAEALDVWTLHAACLLEPADEVVILLRNLRINVEDKQILLSPPRQTCLLGIEILYLDVTYLAW